MQLPCLHFCFDIFHLPLDLYFFWYYTWTIPYQLSLQYIFCNFNILFIAQIFNAALFIIWIKWQMVAKLRLQQFLILLLRTIYKCTYIFWHFFFSLMKHITIYTPFLHQVIVSIRTYVPLHVFSQWHVQCMQTAHQFFLTVLENVHVTLIKRTSV